VGPAYIHTYWYIILIQYKRHTTEYESTDSAHLFCISSIGVRGRWGQVCLRHCNSMKFLWQSPWHVSVRIVWCMIMVSITGTETWRKDADAETHENIGYLWTVANVNTSRSKWRSAAGDENLTIVLLPLTRHSQQHASRHSCTDASKMWSTRTQDSA
jgi:hypothetical protein